MVAKLKTGVIGIDEVGRGPLAGPITVCAVYISNEKEVKSTFFNNSIRDSKKLTKSSRYNIYKTIRKNKKNNKHIIIYSTASRSARYIDKHGISNATHACLKECLKNLLKNGIDLICVPVNLDAGLYIKDFKGKQASHVKGDEKYTEIALASIVAKVVRDAYMTRLSKTNPAYLWEHNAGYGTMKHRKAILEFGVTKYHRLSFLNNLYKQIL